MDTKTISLLREWAKTYNTESFIKDDPVRFPHRFTEKRDIEISAFLTAWISYGRRAHILQKAEELHRLMGESPYEFIRTGETSFAPLRNRPVRRRDTFYRFYTYHDLHLLCCRLKDIYDTYDCMEDAMAPPVLAKILSCGCNNFLLISMAFRSCTGLPLVSVWRCSCVGWCVRMVSSISVSGEQPCIPAN